MMAGWEHDMAKPLAGGTADLAQKLEFKVEKSPPDGTLILLLWKGVAHGTQ